MIPVSSAQEQPLLDVAQLSRSFGARKAVDGVTFSLARGDCLAIFGPNGAGKTTLLRLLAGLLSPTAGRAVLDGIVLPGGGVARRRVGLISHHTLLYEALSPRENVAFAARLYALDRVRDRTSEALARMSMLERADAPLRSLSRGMQQRVSIARAMVHSPEVVLADEPYNGLDDSGARALTSVLRELRGAGAAIVIVTHNIAEGLALASHAAVMHRGRFERLEHRAQIDPHAYVSRYREAVASGG